jgi:riboflavin biosynthesis pyrimidine reductase
MVGASTLEIDRPRLTARDERDGLLERQPSRVVLCRSTAPSREAVGSLREGGEVVLLVQEELAVEARALSGPIAGARVVEFPSGAGLGGALTALGREDVQHLLVEPGPRLLTSLWDDGLLDQLVLVHAGGMAGEGAPPLYEGAPPRDIEELVRAMLAVEAGLVGGDAATVWEPA